MRAIAHSLLFFLLAIPIALYLLYRWRKSASKKPRPSSKSAAGPASVPVKTPSTTSSGGPSILPDLLQSSAYINSLGPSADTTPAYYDPAPPLLDGSEPGGWSIQPWSAPTTPAPIMPPPMAPGGAGYGRYGGGGVVQLPGGLTAYKSSAPPVSTLPYIDPTSA